MANKPDRQTIATFYNRFTSEQLRVGVNIRHRTILRLLKLAGLKRNSAVLEIGCGIGALTGLIGDYCRSGSVLAVDISPEAIEIARQRNRHRPHVQFAVSDMSDFPSTKKFDFIVLPDVLEHIPLSAHRAFFKTLGKHLHPESTVAINIPDPYCLEWFRVHQPEKLQIIDQSLYTDQLLKNIYASGMFLERMHRYALHSQEADYQWLVVRPRPETPAHHFKPIWRIRWQSLRARIFY